MTRTTNTHSAARPVAQHRLARPHAPAAVGTARRAHRAMRGIRQGRGCPVCRTLPLRSVLPATGNTRSPAGGKARRDPRVVRHERNAPQHNAHRTPAAGGPRPPVRPAGISDAPAHLSATGRAFGTPNNPGPAGWRQRCGARPPLGPAFHTVWAAAGLRTCSRPIWRGRMWRPSRKTSA